MAQCVTVDGTTGAVSASSADPCTTLVLLTPDEYATFSLSPFALSPADGATLGFAILGVWAAAWSFRALIKALNVGEVHE